jgi:hypothetical protein
MHKQDRDEANNRTWQHFANSKIADDILRAARHALYSEIAAA